MQGANEYATLFSTGQHGRLYLVSSSHARGRTFHIFVLPDGEEAKPNGNNKPLNRDAVEVYGIVGGQPGWTERYGWLQSGRWCDDFAKLVEDRKCQIQMQQDEQGRQRALAVAQEAKLIAQLLAAY